MKWVIAGLANLVADHRRWGWLVVLILSLPPVLGWWGVHWQEPGQAGWAPVREFQDVPGADDFRFVGTPVLLLLEADDFFRAPRITAIRAAVNELKAHDLVHDVLWLDRIPTPGPLGFPVPLLPRDTASPAAWTRARAAAAQNPLVSGQLLADDGRTMLLQVAPKSLARQSLARIRTIAADHLEATGIRVRMTGLVPIQRALVRAADQEHLHVQLTAYAAVVVLALLIFRRPSAIAIAVSGPLVGTLWALGWLKLLGEPRSDLEPLLPVMFAMIGFTDSVHLVVHLRRERAAGKSQVEATRSAATHIGLACLLTSLTTAIGFGSLLISDAEVVQAFGRGAAVGVSQTFAAVILVVPLLGNSGLGRRIHDGLERDLVARHMIRLSRGMDWIVLRARWVAVGGLLLTATLTALTLTLKPDDWLGNRIERGSEAYQAMLQCEHALGGIEYLRVVVEWPPNAEDVDVLKLLAEVEGACAAEEVLHGPLSLHTWEQVVPRTLLPGPLLEQFWRPDRRRAQVVARHGDLGISQFEPCVRSLQQRLALIADRHPRYRFGVVSPAMSRGQMIQRVIHELLYSLALASVVIFIVIACAFRSFRLGLLAVVPNLFPLVATAGSRVFWNPTLDIASACAFTVCLGIAVDDTIHFLARFEHERGAGGDLLAAMRRTFIAVGNALVITTIVLVSGFGSVFASTLPTHRLFAGVACTTIAAALLGDLVILPALLACWSRKPRGEASTPESR
ncbi:MAG: hypothetical protein CMJ59_20160 [Planctomycetaceae bacterium]|nr:hypothetical protein [Planctomycetaceae bacterium]